MSLEGQRRAARGKGVRNLLPERPGGCCAQKVPDHFSSRRRGIVSIMAVMLLMIVGGLLIVLNLNGSVLQKRVHVARTRMTARAVADSAAAWTRVHRPSSPPSIGLSVTAESTRLDMSSILPANMAADVLVAPGRSGEQARIITARVESGADVIVEKVQVR